MNKRIRSHLGLAGELRRGLASAAGESFAHALALKSLDSHLDELKALDVDYSPSPAIEVLDFSVESPGLEPGAIPLGMLGMAASEIRRMIGYAALRLSEGGLKRSRVPAHLYSELNLRLVGLYQGSSRMVVAADSSRDLFDESIAKNAIARIFGVLTSNGEGEAFLEAVSELGVASARQLRNFLHLLKDTDSEIAITWKYQGEVIDRWDGSYKAIASVVTALDLAELVEKQDVDISGVVELLSKRQRIDLRLPSGSILRIVYPKSLLGVVSKLRLDQNVKLQCHVVETSNPNTGESSILYELYNVVESE